MANDIFETFEASQSKHLNHRARLLQTLPEMT
jgi:hypothetical protein